MSLFTITMVTKPKWFRIAPRERGWGKRPAHVIGFDSEAYLGSPMLFQFSLPGESMPETKLVWATPGDTLQDFLEFMYDVVKEHGRKKRVIVVGWNLRYEYTQLFRDLSPEVWEQGQFVIHLHADGICKQTKDDGWDIMLDVLNEKRYSFTVYHATSQDSRRAGRDPRMTYQVIDGMAFFNTGLDKAAKIVGVEGKVEHPGGDAKKGKIPPHKAIKDELFIRYAKQDAYTTRKIGETIVEYHLRYDISMTISAPMYAAYVFKKRYLDGEIPLCDPEVEDAGLRSYHGGKNGYYLDRPRLFEHAYDYDVNAAYTSAMAVLPDPVRNKWDAIYAYEPGVHALYYVLARVESCIYRAFQENSGRWYTWKEDGDLGFWITSYELDEAMRQSEVLDLYECTGFVLRGESGTGSIRTFCDDMYHLKRFADTPEERQMAKLCLNSLYGKLIQKVPSDGSLYPTIDMYKRPDGTWTHTDVNMIDGGYRAGGLYHPALASLVTGNVRARIHALEHKYQSLMTSTDGFLSLVEPDPADVGEGVGLLKMKEGKLSIWRERLYCFEPEEGDPVFALHGFRGRLADLRKIPLEPGKYGYEATQMIGLRDSLSLHGGKRYTPGQFATVPFDVDLTSVSERSPIRAS